jgi:hypothetical protein
VFLIDALEQLPDEAALADSGNADQGDDLRLTSVTRTAKSGNEAPELLAAPDKRGRAELPDVDAETRFRLERLPHGNRLGLALGLDRAWVAIANRAHRRSIRRLVDEDAVHRRRRLQPRRRVHDVARRHALAFERPRS